MCLESLAGECDRLLRCDAPIQLRLVGCLPQLLEEVYRRHDLGGGEDRGEVLWEVRLRLQVLLSILHLIIDR